MREITNKTHVPTGGAFRYTQPESGMVITSHTVHGLLDKVRAHRRANNYPIGSNFEQEVEEGVCQNQPDICHEVIPPSALEKASMLTKALLRWAVAGFQTVDEAEFSKREEICKSCSYWNGSKSIGKGSCGKCGCKGLKLYLSTEHCPIQKW